MKPHEIELNKFFKFAGFKKGDLVWDYGCGLGRFWPSLKKQGCKIYATDKKYVSLVTPMATISSEPPKEQVDKVLLSCVLHYNEDKSLILHEAYTQLKKGGHIVIIEPNPYNPFFYCLYFWRWLIRSKTTRRWYNEKYMSSRLELLHMLDRQGFRKVEVKKYAWLLSKFG